MTSEDNFSRQASYYVKYRPTYPDHMYRALLGHLKSMTRAWDCATGNGQVAVRLARTFDEVYATDISQTQIDHAPKRNNIKYSLSAAEHTDFEDNFFDLITVAQAIQWFDFDHFYSEVTRTLKTNGILAVIGYGRIIGDEDVDRIIDEFYNKMFSMYFDTYRVYVDNRYKDIHFPFDVVASHDFVRGYKWSLEDLQGFFYSWSSVQKFIEEQGFDPTIEPINKLSGYWLSPRAIKFPVFMKLGRVVK